MLYIFLAILVLYLLIPSKKIRFSIIRFKSYIIPLCIIALLICLVLFSEDVFNSAYNGLVLWVTKVVPSLFPFLICLEILKKTNIITIFGNILEPIIRPLFNIPGSGVFAVIMGMCSGYPIGAKFAASLREEHKCSVIEGNRLLAFTNTSGPLFIVGAVGVGMFADNKVGILLLLTHFIAALLVGILFRFYKYNFKSHNLNSRKIISQVYKNTNRKMSESSETLIKYAFNNNSNIEFKKTNDNFSKKNKSSSDVNLSQLGSLMGDAIKNSISTLLLICGFIVFFCVLGTILDDIGITNLVANLLKNLFVLFGISTELVDELSIGCFKGLLEITSGLKILSASILDYNALLPIVACILGFGGLSVHMQVASIISNTDLSMKPYLIGKSLHGIIAGLLTYFVLNHTNIFNLKVIETFGQITTNNVVSPIGSGKILILGLASLLIISLVVLLFRKKTYTN